LIEFTAITHPGNRYQHNEDAIGWSESAGMFFVADGMGGHARGDIASATVKRALLAAANDPERSLSELVLLAHEAVLLESIEQSLPNMGSTVVLARFRGEILNVAWCGDSRAYLWRAGELTRLTRDHSLLEQLLESGAVAPEEAFGHPRRNVLVQALGINDPPPEPSEIRLTLDNNDVVLLCSDGIHDELRDSTLAEVLGRFAQPGDVVDELERAVLKGDARDNLSAICLRVSELAPRAGNASAALDVQDVESSRLTLPRASAATRRRIVDTLELPVTDTGNDATVTPRSVPKAESPVAATRSPESGSAPVDDNASTRKPAAANDSMGIELWLALLCVALLVVLVVMFT